MNSDIVVDLSPLIRVYKEGRVERLMGTATVPPSLHENTDVQSKDLTISSETGLWARIYIPTPQTSNPKKLPLLVYYHGGAFCMESAHSPTYHNYLNSLVSEANVVAVSVDYRRAPEDPIPIAYDDSWSALKWVGSHSGGIGPEEWVNTYADLTRVYVAGDSAGANIAHRMTMMLGNEKIKGINLRGSLLIHPYFWGTEQIGSEPSRSETAAFIAALWKFTSPKSTGLDDLYINPSMDPNLPNLGCSRVLIAVAESDALRDRGWYYNDLLKKCGWEGEVEVMEAKGEGHIFHLMNPTCDNATVLMKRVATFLKG